MSDLSNIIKKEVRELLTPGSVASVVIMVIVLFFSRGIMGDRELSFAGLVRRVKRRRAARAAEGGETNE